MDGVVVDEIVEWSNPRDENGNSHADLRCDCHYAHPVCWHCGFRAPPCLQLSSERFDGDIIRTRFLDDSAIYIEGEPYLVLFCNACYAEKEALLHRAPSGLRRAPRIRVAECVVPVTARL